MDNCFVCNKKISSSDGFRLVHFCDGINKKHAVSFCSGCSKSLGIDKIFSVSAPVYECLNCHKSMNLFDSVLMLYNLFDSRTNYLCDKCVSLYLPKFFLDKLNFNC